MLKNKVAVITGASRGIGKGIAEKLAKQEMKLILLGSSDDIHLTADEIKTMATINQEQILSIQTDITNEIGKI